MADKTVRLTAPNGATVTTSESNAEELKRRGFTDADTKTTAKKAASSRSSSTKK